MLPGVMQGRSKAAVVVLLLLLAACSDSGDDGAARESIAEAGPGDTTDATDGVDAAVTPVGFTMVVIEVTRPDGTTEQICVWLADSMDERQRGLMEVTDLAGAEGMWFAYDDTTEGQFWMHDTPLPLSIAFFDADGVFVSAADMEPCLDVPTDGCVRYSAAGPYLHALEVSQGRLDELGIEPGSRLRVTGETAESCPAG